MKIAIVGAPGTGKTQLAFELATHLEACQVIDAPEPGLIEPAAFDRVLLMGLDLPAMPDPAPKVDAALRARLAGAGVSFGVVYGQGRERLRAALRLIEPEEGPPPRWSGVCEKCADPECEFRLFTALKNSKAAGSVPT